MSNYKVIIANNNVNPVSPIGLTGLKLVSEKTDNEVFFRQKVSGGLEFVGSDYSQIKYLEDECCKEVSVDILRSCGSDYSIISKARFNTNTTEWDFELCTMKAPSLEIKDSYFGIYKHWEKKVNMCSIEKTASLRYNYRYEDSEKVSNYKNIINNYGVYFSEWLFYCIKQTLGDTEFKDLIPENVQQLSEFITSTFNPCTGKRNSLCFALVFQASDFIYPEKNQATGINNLGILSESLAITMKELFEDLRETFDLYWFIDSGKIRIEHISYFENNLSYADNETLSIDLGLEKYQSSLKHYKHSYKNKNDELYGIEELRMSLNESLFNSKSATLSVSNNDYGTEIFQTQYFFAIISDFSFGNIKYINSCVPYDEKGTAKKKTRTCNLFMTAFEPLRLADDSVDKTKFVLIDALKDSGYTNVHSCIDAICERTSKKMTNGNFSATAIMRDFLRYRKSFDVGLMSYSEKPSESGDIGKGYTRKMYSVIPTKQLKPVSIPFCCEDSGFNPFLDLKLPNGTTAKVGRVEYDFASETLNIEPFQNNKCSVSIFFPTLQTGDNYPPKGTVLNTETVEVQVSYDNICDDYGCFMQPVYETVTRTTYADGEGGTYIEDK